MNRQARPAPPSPNLVIIKGEEGERRDGEEKREGRNRGECKRGREIHDEDTRRVGL